MNRKYYYGKNNIADWFSIYRIAASPLLLILVFLGKETFFTWLLLLSFTTDMIDGFLARRLGIVTERGARLDSTGDFLTVLVAVAGVLNFEWNFITEHAVSIAILVILYIIPVLVSLWRFRKISSFHTYTSKVVFFIQGAFVLSLLLFGYYPWFFYLALASGIIDSIEEIIIIFLLPVYSTNVKGIYWVLRDRKTRAVKK